MDRTTDAGAGLGSPRWWTQVDVARLLARCQQMVNENPALSGRAAAKLEQVRGAQAGHV